VSFGEKAYRLKKKKKKLKVYRVPKYLYLQEGMNKTKLCYLSAKQLLLNYIEGSSLWEQSHHSNYTD